MQACSILPPGTQTIRDAAVGMCRMLAPEMQVSRDAESAGCRDTGTGGNAAPRILLPEDACAWLQGTGAARVCLSKDVI